MSQAPDDVSKLTESTYKNVMEQFNPSLRNLVNLGKSYEKSVAAMTLAGNVYFDAVSKIGENATISPVSRELGVVLMEIAEAHKKVYSELEENFKRFHQEVVVELEKKTEMDIKYMNATFKRYQSEHKLKQDSLARSQTDLKKLRRKKHSTKYEIKENEYMETISSRQMDMQKFIADGCREALLEEKRRFCFLADKHCMFSYQISNFHDKAKEILSLRLPSWQEKCCDITKVPDTVMSMIDELSNTPEQSPLVQRYNMNNVETVVPPPAPPVKAQFSPLVNMFNPDPRSPLTSSSDQNSDQGSLGEGSLSRSTSQSSGLNVGRRTRVRTIFPHTAGNNNTLLSFDDGDVITLLLHEEKDGWLYGELEKTGQRGWFPSSYCRPCTDLLMSNSNVGTPVRSPSVASLPEQEEEEPVLLPPPDYSDDPPSMPVVPSTPSPQNTQVSLVNGIAKAPFLGGGNPFATVKLRPTVTNDRSAPII
ncbi:brain-specific angiogenesis inhibitor 1-associated protein 2-like protein 1a isoform 1-T1 [Aulostomus maculatus]